MNRRPMKRVVVLAVVVAMIGALSTVASAQIDEEGTGTTGVVGFDSYPVPLPGSSPSLGYAATSTDEFGDHIAFDAGVGRDLATVDVVMTSWTCENDIAGDPTGSREPDEPCVTTPGSSYQHPITLNLYAVDYGAARDGGPPMLGALIASKTATFDIPYRPSWDSVNCTADGETPATDTPFGGKWYDPVLGACVHGYNHTITFDFSADGVVLPDEVIYGVAYNTSSHGENPTGTPGDYDSLNVGLALVPPATGTDVEPSTLWWDTSHGPFYCDGGAGGTDTFRRDWDPAGCWGDYIPIVEFEFGAYTCNGLVADIVGTDGPDTLTGTPGPDVIVALGGDDAVYGMGGPDTICLGAGNDTAWGGAGADVIFAETGDNVLIGNLGDDILLGGDGNDTLWGRLGDDILAGGLGDDTLIGNDGNDTLYGRDGADVLRGGWGDDTLYGEYGDDALSGGPGDDTLRGGPEDDHLYGRTGMDSLNGGPGTDYLNGGAAFDVCAEGETYWKCNRIL